MPRGPQSTVLPAHETKHIPELEYTFLQSSFRLLQLDNGISNGTALWLGAQCLSVFLAHIYGNKHPTKPSGATRRPRAIELGSGIGLSAYVLVSILNPSHFSCNGCYGPPSVSLFWGLCSLALSSMGWDVVATDLPIIVDAVLSRNIADNLYRLPPGSGTIQVRALDWTVPPEDWSWDDVKVIAAESGTHSPSPPPSGTSLLAPPFDLIITSDTVYSTTLAKPLIRTLQALWAQSSVASPKGSMRVPPIYVCLERRDSVLVDQTLAEAANLWTVKRVPHGKVTHALEKGGLLWDISEWEGVEVWTFAQKSS